MSSHLVQLPVECNYIEAYLTLRCPLRCSYCINNKSGKAVKKRNELSAEQWASGINRVNFGNVPLTLGGGEPTFHKEFYKVMDLLRADIKIDLLTNLQFDVDEFIRNISPERFQHSPMPAYKSIRVSYHAEQMNAEQIIEKIIKLQNNDFRVGIFGINHPLNIEKNMQMAELACNNKVFFFIKDFLGEYDGRMFGFYNYPDALSGIPRKVQCRTRELLIGPSGNIYKCHRDLYVMDRECSVGNITDSELKIEYKYRPCKYYGYCNPCDIKIKTNRFLQMGHCSVEIIPEDNDD